MTEAGSADVTRIRRELLLELVSNCNLRCKMCAYVRGFTKERMSNQVVAAILADVPKLRDAGSPYLFDSLRLDGNTEPLLAKDLGRLICLARQAGITRSNITTNGLLLTQDVSEDLVQSGLTTLDISMTGITPDVYREFQGAGLTNAECQANIERTCANISTFLAARKALNGKTRVTLRYIVSRLSQHHFLDYMDYFRALGVDAVLLMTYCEESAFRTMPSRPGGTLGRKRCGLPSHPVVRANGDVVFAACAYDVPVLGNVYEKSFFDILTQDTTVRYLTAMDSLIVPNLPTACAECHNTHVCG